MFWSSNMHAAGSDYILQEGNIGSGSGAGYDPWPASGEHLFSQLLGRLPERANNGALPLYNTIPVIIGAYSRYNNYLANVWAPPGYHTVYQCNPASPSQQYCSVYGWNFPGYTHIWDIGWSHSVQLDYNNNPPLPNDLLTASSLYRYGNYDTVSGAVQSNSADVPTSDPNFPNAVPSGTLPQRLFITGWHRHIPVRHGTLILEKSHHEAPVHLIRASARMCPAATSACARAGLINGRERFSAGQCAGRIVFPASTNAGHGSSNPRDALPPQSNGRHSRRNGRHSEL